MLISCDEILPYMSRPLKGIIHVGAHECEEREVYERTLNMGDDRVVWVEALPEKVQIIREKYPGVKILEACVSDKDGVDTKFIVTNNYQSSSILNLKDHLTEHPYIHPIEEKRMTTQTLGTVLQRNGVDALLYNMLCLDIQGAELLVLQGASNLLPHIDYIYCEVNDKELYENCGLTKDIDAYLSTHGFQRVLTKMTIHGWGDAFYTKQPSVMS